MDERRRFIRFETSLGLKYAVPQADSDDSIATSRDISREGLCISTNRLFSEGTVLEMRLDVPGDNMPVLAQCKVAWARESYSGSNNFNIGLKFVQMTGLDKSRLLEYVYSQWLRAKGFMQEA